MKWIGQKKIAFIPVYRPNARPPDQIPTDWPNQILRRVLFDPDLNINADRSLRTYVHAVSYGRADLDAVVMPMVTIDQQDVPPDILEGQLGSQLRNQGFDAAAIVMLGGVGAGTGQAGGFWARFVMAEGVGVWAMELIHCLTGYWDLYIYLQPPFWWFDNMACACGTHPSAFTKLNFGWLDQSAIKRHFGRAGTYALHSLGLVQPPPSGRCTAVQVGPSDPFLMIEARQMVDQFDGYVDGNGNTVIPNNGVIVYEVVTSDEDPSPNITRPKVLLKTQAPLTIGQAFTSDTNVTVSVTGSIPGGFTVVVIDGNAAAVWNHNDLTEAAGAPGAAGDPTGYTWDVDSTQHVVYRGTDGHIHELWFSLASGWNHNDLTQAAGASGAAGNPSGYTWDGDSTQHVVYRGTDGHIHELWFSLASNWNHNDLTQATGAPGAASDPTGYTWDVDSTQHVVYRGTDGHIHELWFASDWNHNDLTQATGAPSVAGDPTGYTWDVDSTQHVVYRGTDGHIHELWLTLA